MRIIAILLVFTSLEVFTSGNTCNCRKPITGETTHWGNSDVIVQEDKIFKSIRGVVQRPDGSPMPDTLVEIYNRPEGLLLDWRERKERDSRQHRIAACKTGDDGNFCFVNIPPGKYELRSRKPTEKCCGWDTTRAYIILNPRKRNSTSAEIETLMNLSI
jgi:hypothetical protein